LFVLMFFVCLFVCALTGSAASMLQCANHMWRLRILPDGEQGIADLEDMVFHGPLRLIGLTGSNVACSQPCVVWSQAEGFVLAR
jgi:hypothetical protein